MCNNESALCRVGFHDVHVGASNVANVDDVQAHWHQEGDLTKQDVAHKPIAGCDTVSLLGAEGNRKMNGPEFESWRILLDEGVRSFLRLRLRVGVCTIRQRGNIIPVLLVKGLSIGALSDLFCCIVDLLTPPFLVNSSITVLPEEVMKLPTGGVAYKARACVW